MRQNRLNTEVPEIVNAKCQAAYAQIYKECEAMKTKRTIKMKKSHIIAACAAAALVIVPTTAMAYEYLHARMEQTGNYENTVIITPQPTESAESVEETPVQFMALNIGWLPEGYVFNEIEGKYHSEAGGGISYQFLRLPENMTVTEQLRNTVSSEQYTKDGKQILIAQKADRIGEQGDRLSFNRELWVVFDGTSYAVRAWLTSDLSEADVKQFAESLTLTPSETETAGDYLPEETGGGGGAAQSAAPKVLRDELNLIAIGEAAELNYTGIYAEDTISMTVTDAWFQKNFDGIEGDYSEYLDENGNVADIVRTWYNPGDGVNTLDEEVLSESVPQKVLVVKATYTNDSDHAVEHTIFPTLFTLQNGMAYKNGYPESDIAERNTEFLHPLKSDGCFFSLQSESSIDKNTITIPAGESVDVQIAYLVSEELQGSLYMNMHLNFSLTVFDEKFPVLDLCEVK